MNCTKKFCYSVHTSEVLVSFPSYEKWLTSEQFGK